jgi:hypothetical protein
MGRLNSSHNESYTSSHSHYFDILMLKTEIILITLYFSKKKVKRDSQHTNIQDLNSYEMPGFLKTNIIYSSHLNMDSFAYIQKASLST